MKAAIGLLAVLLLTALPAEAAEVVKLRGGRELAVDAVRIESDVVNVTIRKDGGTARVDLGFERLDPRGLLDLLDRYTDAESAPARLRAARVALRFGLAQEAAERFRQAAALDPSLAGERDAALERIRTKEAADALRGLEELLREGAPRAALARAAALLQGGNAATFEAGQLLRITALARLAERLVEREAVQVDPLAGLAPEEGPAPAPAPKLPQGAAPPPAPPAGGVPAAAEKVLAELSKARHARESAANPKISAQRAIRYLETAARSLLDGRRLLQKVPDAFGAASDDAHAELRALLVATYLDLADLYRRRGDYSGARAMIRSVLILDPGNDEAREQRRLIEDDLRKEYEPERPYGTSFYRIGPYGYGPYFGYSRYYLGGHPFHHHHGVHTHGHIGGAHFSFRFGGAHHHHGHTTRHVGRRR